MRTSHPRQRAGWGKALWYAELNTPKICGDLLKLPAFSMPRVVLGRGSNLIIPDEGYHGLVLRLRGNFWNEIVLGPMILSWLEQVPDSKIFAG